MVVKVRGGVVQGHSIVGSRGVGRESISTSGGNSSFGWVALNPPVQGEGIVVGWAPVASIVL